MAGTEPTRVASLDGLWDEKHHNDRPWWRRWFKCRHNSSLWFDWPDRVDYETDTGPFGGAIVTVCACPICRKRILVQYVTTMYPTIEANALIDDEIMKMGLSPRLRKDGSHAYGSGYYLELPVSVSQILTDKGETAARAYIRRQFGKDGCQEAFNDIYGEAP
jgi:hypothetical protein